MQQEMYQRRNSAEDSLIMTNNWAHATMPAEWAQGQVEFKWGKKKTTSWHVSDSVVHEEYTWHSGISA